MKNTEKIVWGILLIAVGVIFALNSLGIWNVELFFDGWWTLFLIVPCGIGLFTEREKLGNLIGLLIGVFLLLCCQDVLEFKLLWKLLVPAVIVLVGVKLLFGALFDRKAREACAELQAKAGAQRSGCGIFSGCDMKLDGQVFEGAELNAIFGGVDCDLRNAIIEKDCMIKATAVFGGIDIKVPDTVKVQVNSTSIFGGATNKASGKNGAATIYVSATCLFGGVDIQ